MLACLSLPCQNGGTCNEFFNFYTCTCPASHIGNNCEQGKLLMDYRPYWITPLLLWMSPSCRANRMRVYTLTSMKHASCSIPGLISTAHACTHARTRQETWCVGQIFEWWRHTQYSILQTFPAKTAMWCRTSLCIRRKYDLGLTHWHQPNNRFILTIDVGLVLVGGAFPKPNVTFRINLHVHPFQTGTPESHHTKF